jgi:hypothetical protein
MSTVKISSALPEQATLAAEIAQLRELDVSTLIPGVSATRVSVSGKPNFAAREQRAQMPVSIERPSAET